MTISHYANNTVFAKENVSPVEKSRRFRGLILSAIEQVSLFSVYSINRSSIAIATVTNKMLSANN